MSPADQPLDGRSMTPQPMDIGEVAVQLQRKLCLEEPADAAERKNPQFCAEYIEDIYRYLRELEVRMSHTLNEQTLTSHSRMQETCVRSIRTYVWVRLNPTSLNSHQLQNVHVCMNRPCTEFQCCSCSERGRVWKARSHGATVILERPKKEDINCLPIHS